MSKKGPRTIAFLKFACKNVDQPFTVFDLTEFMRGKRYHFPTLPELQHMLSKMDFIEMVGEKYTLTGKAKTYAFKERVE